MAVFSFKCVRNVVEKAVTISVIILQHRKVKQFNFKILNFRAQQYEDIWPTKVRKPWREKGGAHADMVPEGFGNFLTKGDRLAKSRDVNPLETIWIIVDETLKQRSIHQNTGRAKAVTTFRLEKCAFRHPLGGHIFYTSPLIKCQIT